MSIKTFDPNANKWVVQANNLAQDTYVVDGEGNYESNNVEGALKEIAQELDSLNDRVEYIYENGTIGGGGGGGGGSSNLPTITLMSDANVSARTDETVDIYVLFATPNAGNGTLSYSISSTYADGNVDGSKPTYESFNRTVTAGKLRISIPGHETGTHRINIYVTDAMGLVSNSVDVTITSGSLELRKLTVSGGEQYFNDEVDATFETPLKIAFRVSALDTSTDIKAFISIDGISEEKTVNAGINIIDYGLVSNKFQHPGNHRIEIYVVQGTNRSNTILWNVTLIDSESLIISSPMEENLTQQMGKTTAIEFRNSMQGYSRFITQVTVNGGRHNISETLTTDIGINTWSLGNILDEPGVTYTLTIQSHTMNTSGGIGTYHSNILTFYVTVTASEDFVPWQSVTDGAICIFEANTGNNASQNRNLWFDKRGQENHRIVGKLNGFNYSNTSGWNSENASLAFSGKAYVEFYDGFTTQITDKGTEYILTEKFRPFKDGIGMNGFTIDVRFKVQCIGDILSKVLWCENNVTPFNGFHIGIDTAKFSTDKSNAIEANFKEDQWTNVTYVFYRPVRDNKNYYNAQNQNMLILYINGVLSKASYLAQTDDNLRWDGSLLLGTMIDELGQLNHYGMCEIQALRLYDRSLSDEEVLQNFIADHKDEDTQMKIRERNYGSMQIPTMTMTIPNYESMTDETAVEATVVYNDPADPSKNFSKDGCRVISIAPSYRNVCRYYMNYWNISRENQKLNF